MTGAHLHSLGGWRARVEPGFLLPPYLPPERWATLPLMGVLTGRDRGHSVK